MMDKLQGCIGISPRLAGCPAIGAIGAVPALINARAGREEFNHCLASTQCRAAFGVPDERLGEKLAATVVPQPDRELDEAELLGHCMKHLARHKVPKQVRVQRNPLPRNASGKAVKPRIRQLYLEYPERANMGRIDSTRPETTA